MTVEQAYIGFVGAGNMAQSLIGGLLAQGYPKQNIGVSDPSPESLAIAKSLGVAAHGNNRQLAEQADVLVLAVKPQIMPLVIRDLAGGLSTDAPLLISIAAGVSCDALQQWAGKVLPIVRCMPNTPALLREGATGLFANASASAEQKQVAQDILDAVGLTVWVENESDLDAVTALSGSGPAYFFLLLELMQLKATALGLSPDIALKLAQQTALGASRMALESDVPVAELRRRVTSPNGTTEAAINSFIENGLGDLVEKALNAAYERSKSLAKELAEQ